MGLQPARGQSRAAERGAPIFGRWRLPSYYGWVIVGVVFLAEFSASGMGGTALSLFFPSLNKDLGWSLTSLTGAITAQTIAGMVTAPLIGPLLDRFGARPVMLAGAAVAGTGLLLLTGIHAIWQFWVLFAMVGALGLAELGTLTAPVVVAKWFIRRRGRAMAIATSGTAVGGWVMAPIIGFLIGTVGWRSTIGVLGIVLLVLNIPAVALFMRRQPEDMGLQPDGDEPNSAEAASDKAPPRQVIPEPSWTLRAALRTRTLWLLVISFNLVGFSTGSLLWLLVPYFVEKGLSLQSATFVYTLAWVGFSLSRLVWGFAVERFPIRLCLIVQFGCRALGVLLLVVIPSLISISPFLLLFAVVGGGMSLLQAVTFANYYGRASIGQIQGGLRPLFSLQQLVGPVLLAWMRDASGSFNLPFLIASGLAFLAAVIVLFASPPTPKSSRLQPNITPENLKSSSR